MSNDPSGFIPPVLMLRSFLTLGSSLVLHVAAFLGVVYLVGMFFPEYQAFLDLPAEQRENVQAMRPYEAIPKTMFAIVVVVSFFINALLGAYATRTAPFSHQTHSIFFAVLLFVFYLQRAGGEEPEKKSMTLILMVAMPIAIMLGGRYMYHRMLDRWQMEDAVSEASDEESSSDSDVQPN